MKYYKKIPTLIYKKTFWQVILTLLFVVFFIYFIKNEHLELFKIRVALAKSDTLYVIAGLVVTLLYIYLQGELYVRSFRSIHQRLGVFSAMNLYLKRNFLSVFLPAGGFSSLAFFNKELDKHNISRTQGYYGSYIFMLCGLLSVVVVAVPAIIFLFIQGNLRSLELYAFLFLLVMIAFLISAVYSIIRKGWAYKILDRYQPDWVVIFEEIKEQNFSIKQFLLANFVSVLIEITGILHLYISMLAIGVTPSWEAAVLGYIVMVLILIASPFLRGIGAIEVSMTYILTQYNYDTITAASITLLFRLFEFWIPLVAGIFGFVAKKGSVLIRVLPAFIILSLGIINVVSAITPAIPARLRLIENLLPPEIAQASNFAVAVFGVILIILSSFLFVGARNAWKLGLILTAASTFGHLVKGGDYEEAIFSTVAFISLLFTRKAYFIRHDVAFQRKRFTNIVIAVLAVFVYDVAGFYFLNKRHFGTEFDLQASFNTFFKVFFLFDNDVLIPKTMFARGFLYSLYLMGAAVFIYAMFVVFKPFIKNPNIDEAEKSLAEQLIEQYGKSTLDYFKTYFDKLLFFNEDKTCFLAYRVANNYAVVLEDPVGPSSDVIVQTIQAFEEFCYKSGLKSFYYRVPEESLPIYHSLKKKSLLIGQEAILNLPSFTLQGGDKKSIRNALKKVESSGLKIQIYEPPVSGGVIQKIEQVSEEWLESMERSELIFTQGLFDEEILKTNTLLTVENAEEKVVAFANIVPMYTKTEGTYDLIRKSDDAPNGTLDYLMVNIFEYLKDKGFQTVNLGLAPLAGLEKGENLTERTIKYARDNFRQMSRFKGLYDYKDKFQPEWKNKYLIYGNTYELVQFPMILGQVSKIEED